MRTHKIRSCRKRSISCALALSRSWSFSSSVLLVVTFILEIVVWHVSIAALVASRICATSSLSLFFKFPTTSLLNLRMVLAWALKVDRRDATSKVPTRCSFSLGSSVLAVCRHSLAAAMANLTRPAPAATAQISMCCCWSINVHAPTAEKISILLMTHDTFVHHEHVKSASPNFLTWAGDWISCRQGCRRSQSLAMLKPAL